MDSMKQYRLENELKRNNKRIEDVLKEASILDERNAEIRRQLSEGQNAGKQKNSAKTSWERDRKR